VSDDAWYESEESTGRGMIEELQRIRRRLIVRPLPVLALALAITGAITWKVVTRPPRVEAEVVLLLEEGSLATTSGGLPADELRAYVTGVLLPDSKLATLIEQRDLYRARTTRGMPYAIDELRDHLEVEVWKNTFASGGETERSARIGITVADSDADRAFDLARELAAIVIQSVAEQRQQVTKQLADQLGALRDGLIARLGDLARQRAETELALRDARDRGQARSAETLQLQLVEISAYRERAERTLSEIAHSRDIAADQFAAAGLELNVQVVEERRPERSLHHGFVVVLITIVVAVGSLLGSALVVGAFDGRVHDLDDVTRLGLPVLGHVPGFPGDGVGALAVRDARRRRVPSFLRWRSPR
jgi:hypothetical protein